MQLRVVVLLVLVQIAIANINTTTTNVTTGASLTTQKVGNETDTPKGNLTQLIELNANNTRRKCRTIKKKKLKDRSTSSSSGDKEEDNSDGGNKESLDLSGSSLSNSQDRDQPPNPNATGWRKWHRRCTPCLEDMMRKWRDPSISWICGAYQRARRSFKSECMMYYRNCQDGTMFIKIHERRCSDADIPYHGKHFFYDYKVQLSDVSSSKSDSRKKSDSDDSPESRSSDTIEDLVFRRDTQPKRTLKKKAGRKKGKKSKSSKKDKSQANAWSTRQGE